MACSMNEILSKDVFLVETIDARHDAASDPALPGSTAAGGTGLPGGPNGAALGGRAAGQQHLKAVCLLRPTADNIRALQEHLKQPQFAEYHLFFTSIVPQDLLRRLADADHMAVVKQVVEAFADFYPINGDTFSANLHGTLTLSHRPRSAYSPVEDGLLKRSTQALLSLLLAFKVKPHVRYQASSDAARVLASEIAGSIGGERELFTFNRSGAGAPLLLIVDRREDPITPLLSQWTYQAMIHELLPGGIRNHTVDMRSVQGVNKDLEEIVITPTQDAFFRDTMYANYGDAGEAVQRALNEYSAQHRLMAPGGLGPSAAMTSIEDMQRFVERFPELRSKGLSVSKHVALMSEISRAVDARRLMEISELEQNVACSDNPNDQFRDITTLLASGPIDPFDALRLLMLYAIRYERSRPDKVSELRRFVESRVDLGPSAGLLDALLRYGGSSVRGSSDMLLGAGGGVLTKLTSTVRRGLAGVSNVFTQHQPLLVSQLDQLARGRLAKAQYPFVGAEAPPGAKISTVIVFVVGGCTYEEAAKVAAINAGQLPLGAGPGPLPSGQAAGAGAVPFRVVLGGTCVQNSKSFLAEIKRLMDSGSAGGMAGGAGMGPAGVAINM
jgi:vacuolar protein sorting-associated protein 45